MRARDRDETARIGGREFGGSSRLDDKYFVATDALLAAMAGAPKIDYERFRADVDAYVDQDPTPRFWDRV